ncbi:MAG: cytochrome c [Chloroflexota bacterium]
MDIDRAGTSDVDDASDGEKKSSRGCIFWLIVLLVLVGGGVATAGLMGTIILREETPLPGEEFISDLGLRLLAVPGEYHDRKIPQKAGVTAANGKALFDVQCAFCHGQNGDGSAQLGATMYPRSAILTSSRTQTKTDGELFWLIEHGINLTGMPAWGTNYGGANSEDEIWSMVAYIRELAGR